FAVGLERVRAFLRHDAESGRELRMLSAAGLDFGVLERDERLGHLSGFKERALAFTGFPIIHVKPPSRSVFVLLRAYFDLVSTPYDDRLCCVRGFGFHMSHSSSLPLARRLLPPVATITTATVAAVNRYFALFWVFMCYNGLCAKTVVLP